MIMPTHLHREEERLVKEYMQSTEDCGMIEYVTKHSSDELKAYYKAYDSEKKWAEERGIIIN